MNYEFNFLTDYWEGTMQYGEFIGHSWLAIGARTPCDKKNNK
jgi:hypothetical protein